MRFIVGIGGASGVILGKRFLEVLKEKGIKTDLIITSEGKSIISQELKGGIEEIKKLSFRVWDVNDFSAEISSGSSFHGKNKRDALIVVPCSMNTVAKMANGIADNLLLRVFDVMLKENKKIIVVPREAPLNTNHLRNLLSLREMGVTVIMPVLTFYHKPKKIDDMVDFIVGKILDSLCIEHKLFKRWETE